jgi:hypothetical protein
MDDLAAEDGHHRADVDDLIVGHGEEIVGEQREIGQLSFDDLALLALFVREPGVGLRPQAQRGFRSRRLRTG